LPTSLCPKWENVNACDSLKRRLSFGWKFAPKKGVGQLSTVEVAKACAAIYMSHHVLTFQHRVTYCNNARQFLRFELHSLGSLCFNPSSWWWAPIGTSGCSCSALERK
jgi:hypothetical protein